MKSLTPLTWLVGIVAGDTSLHVVSTGYVKAANIGLTRFLITPSQGRVFSLQQRCGETLPEIEAALRLAPDSPDISDGLLIIILFHRPDCLAALALARGILDGSPNDMWLHQGDLLEATRWMEKTRLLHPHGESLLVYLAGNYLLRGMPADRIESLKQAIRLNLKNPYPNERLADVYQRRGFTAEAIGVLRGHSFFA